MYEPSSQTLKLHRMSRLQWHERWDSQDRRCAICGTTEPGNGGWCIDHDHSTEQRRGILCSKCNLMIGFSGDSATILVKGAIYLKEWRDRAKLTTGLPSEATIEESLEVIKRPDKQLAEMRRMAKLVASGRKVI